MKIVVGNIFILSILSVWSPAICHSREPTLSTVYASDMHVTGEGVPQERVTVFDTSYPARAKLGEAVISADGTFAVALKIPLREGNSIVAEDGTGRTGRVIMVKPRRIAWPILPRQ